MEDVFRVASASAFHCLQNRICPSGRTWCYEEQRNRHRIIIKPQSSCQRQTNASRLTICTLITATTALSFSGQKLYDWNSGYFTTALIWTLDLYLKGFSPCIYRGLVSQSVGGDSGNVPEDVENETGTFGQELHNSSLCGYCGGSAVFVVWAWIWDPYSWAVGKTLNLPEHQFPHLWIRAVIMPISEDPVSQEV